MKYVYIASPYTRGDVALNVREQINTAERLMRLGYIPYTPTLMHFHHMIHPHEYEEWMLQCLAWVGKCDCLLRLPGESIGADREEMYAVALRKPVFYSVEEILAADPNPF